MVVPSLRHLLVKKTHAFSGSENTLLTHFLHHLHIIYPQVFDNGVNPKDNDADEGNSGSKQCLFCVWSVAATYVFVRVCTLCGT